MKFYETAKYYFYPGMHEPGGGLSFGMNEKWWHSLDKWEQEIIRTCCYEEHSAQYEEATANDGKFLNKLINEHGVKLRQFSDEIYDSFGEASVEVYQETREHSPLAARVLDDFIAARDELDAWIKLAEIAFSLQRNRVVGL